MDKKSKFLIHYINSSTLYVYTYLLSFVISHYDLFTMYLILRYALVLVYRKWRGTLFLLSEEPVKVNTKFPSILTPLISLPSLGWLPPFPYVASYFRHRSMFLPKPHVTHGRDRPYLHKPYTSSIPTV